MGSLDLIEGLADVLLSENPRSLASLILGSLAKAVPLARAALFAREQDQMLLFVSRNVDQDALDAVSEVWERNRRTLEEGVRFFAAGGSHQSAAVRKALLTLGKDGALAIIPSRARTNLVGLLYLDSPQPLEEAQLAVAVQLAGLGAVALKAPPSNTSEGFLSRGASVDSYLERMPQEEIQRDQLLLLLTRNEWNIARVARILGVTRRTIYLRLERLNIKREKVAKSPPRTREAT